MNINDTYGNENKNPCAINQHSCFQFGAYTGCMQNYLSSCKTSKLRGSGGSYECSIISKGPKEFDPRDRGSPVFGLEV